MFLNNYGEMYHVYVYNDVIDDFITINDFLKVTPTSIKYIINDVMCRNIIQYRYLFLNTNLIYLAAI